MNGLKVKCEGLSKRCEICHQSDCFIPKLNQCSRCDKTKIKESVGVHTILTHKRSRRIFSDTFWRKINGSTEPRDYLTPYNWFLAQEAKAHLVAKEKEIKSWWHSEEIINELVVAPIVWIIISTIFVASFYLVTKDLFFTLLSSAVVIVFFAAIIIGTALKLVLKKRQAVKFFETEKYATNQYVENLLYKE